MDCLLGPTSSITLGSNFLMSLKVSFSLSNLCKWWIAYLVQPLLSPEDQIFLIFKKKYAYLAHQNSRDVYLLYTALMDWENC